jgi:hypothetical protein
MINENWLHSDENKAIVKFNEKHPEAQLKERSTQYRKGREIFGNVISFLVWNSEHSNECLEVMGVNITSEDNNQFCVK